MIVNYGDREFYVEDDFIQLLNCYEEGKCCFTCPEFAECGEEMEFVLEDLYGNRID